MHVHFMVPGANTLEHLCGSSLASTRLRIGVAARAINSTKGNECSYGEDIPGKPIDVILVGKIGANDVERRGDAWLSKLRGARQEGTKVILDLTDNHLDAPSSMSNFYREAITLSDLIVVPSAKMKHHLARWAMSPVVIIPDSIEYEAIRPRQTRTLNGIWFGHGSNLRYLVDRIEERALLARVESLTICTDTNSLKMLQNARIRPCFAEINYVPWSVSNLGAALKKVDFAFLPVGLDDVKKSGAGPNRLLTALTSGLAVFTQPLASYIEFREYFQNIDDSNMEIDEDTIHLGKIKAGLSQSRIIQEFNQTELGLTWKHLISIIH